MLSPTNVKLLIGYVICCRIVLSSLARALEVIRFSKRQLEFRGVPYSLIYVRETQLRQGMLPGRCRDQEEIEKARGVQP